MPLGFIHIFNERSTEYYAAELIKRVYKKLLYKFILEYSPPENGNMSALPSDFELKG
jgi:hypothetical protein